MCVCVCFFFQGRLFTTRPRSVGEKRLSFWWRTGHSCLQTSMTAGSIRRCITATASNGLTRSWSASAARHLLPPRKLLPAPKTKKKKNEVFFCESCYRFILLHCYAALLCPDETNWLRRDCRWFFLSLVRVSVSLVT